MNIFAYCQFKEGYNEAFRARVREICPNAQIDYYEDKVWDEAEYHEKLRKTEVILGHIPPKDLPYCESLNVMLMDIAGADMYLSNPALRDDVIICNASGAYGVILAEHAVAMIMALRRSLPEYGDKKHAHCWGCIGADKAIEESTVLILGAGDIGVNTARLLRPLAGKIVGVRRVKRAVPELFDEMIGFDELDEWLPHADIIACSLPATRETKHLLNERRLRLMKKDAVLVNVGRGSLIPTEDLCRVLRDGHLRGVGIDVAETEPLPENSPLWGCERLIITPHVAGNSITQDSPTNRRIFEIIYHNLENYAAGRPLDHVVDRVTGYRATSERL